MKTKNVLGRLLVISTILTLVAAGIACSSKSSNTKPLSSVTISPPSPGNLAVGVTTQFTATGKYADGSTADVSALASWKSSDQQVAGVSSEGLISGKGAGTTDITASFSGVTSPAVKLTVIVRSLSSIEISPTSPPELAIGSNQQFAAVGRYSDGSTSDLSSEVKWASSNTAVATIDAKSGVATGIAQGVTNIAASLAGNSIQPVNLTVAAKALSSINVTPTATDTLPVGLTEQFIATAYYSDQEISSVSTEVTWTSSDTSVATISPSGLVTAVGTGVTMITATMSGVTSTAIPVPVAVLKSVTITPGQPGVLTVGTNQRFVALATYADGSVAVVTSQATWASSDTTIATVSSSGVGTGAANGNTNITASFAGVSSQAITLKVATLSSIAITPASPSNLAVQSTQQFTATGTYSDGTTVDLTSEVTWASSDTTIATIDATGLATGILNGNTNITATFAGVSSPPVPLTTITP